MIKAIIFDWAGVLASDGFWVWLKEYIPNIEEEREYLQKLSEEADKAVITTEEFASSLAEKTGVSPEKVWPEMRKRIVINKDLFSIIKRLKKRYKIGLLSNFTYQWLGQIFVDNNLYPYFDALFISSRHKLIKPEPEAFQKILDMLSVTKDEAIFIDDRQVHVDASNQFGIKAILYTNNEKLKQDLKENVGEI